MEQTGGIATPGRSAFFSSAHNPRRRFSNNQRLKNTRASLSFCPPLGRHFISCNPGSTCPHHFRRRVKRAKTKFLGKPSSWVVLLFLLICSLSFSLLFPFASVSSESIAAVQTGRTTKTAPRTSQAIALCSSSCSSSRPGRSASSSSPSRSSTVPVRWLFLSFYCLRDCLDRGEKNERSKRKRFPRTAVKNVGRLRTPGDLHLKKRKLRSSFYESSCIQLLSNSARRTTRTKPERAAVVITLQGPKHRSKAVKCTYTRQAVDAVQGPLSSPKNFHSNQTQTASKDVAHALPYHRQNWPSRVLPRTGLPSHERSEAGHPGFRYQFPATPQLLRFSQHSSFCKPIYSKCPDKALLATRSRCPYTRNFGCTRTSPRLLDVLPRHISTSFSTPTLRSAAFLPSCSTSSCVLSSPWKSRYCFSGAFLHSRSFSFHPPPVCLSLLRQTVRSSSSQTSHLDSFPTGYSTTSSAPIRTGIPLQHAIHRRTLRLLVPFRLGSLPTRARVQRLSSSLAGHKENNLVLASSLSFLLYPRFVSPDFSDCRNVSSFFQAFTPWTTFSTKLSLEPKAGQASLVPGVQTLSNARARGQEKDPLAPTVSLPKSSFHRRRENCTPVHATPSAGPARAPTTIPRGGGLLSSPWPSSGPPQRYRYGDQSSTIHDPRGVRRREEEIDFVTPVTKSTPRAHSALRDPQTRNEGKDSSDQHAEQDGQRHRVRQADGDYSGEDRQHRQQPVSSSYNPVWFHICEHVYT